MMLCPNWELTCPVSRETSSPPCGRAVRVGATMYWWMVLLFRFCEGSVEGDRSPLTPCLGNR